MGVGGRCGGARPGREVCMHLYSRVHLDPAVDPEAGGRRYARHQKGHQKGVVLPVTCKPFNLRTPGNVGNSELGTRSREYSYSWVPHAALVILSI